MNIKNLSLAFVAVFLFIGTFAYAQPDKAAKKAKSAYASYNMNQESNFAKLQEGKEASDEAIQGIDQIEDKKQVDVWLNRGQIYLELFKNPIYKSKFPEAISEAYAAYEKVLTHPLSKKFQQKSAATDLKSCAFEFWNAGTAAYQAQDFAAAFDGFNKVLEVRALVLPVDETADPLAGKDEESGESKYLQHVESTAFLATLGGKNDKAIELFQRLLTEGYSKPGVYDGLFKAYQNTNMEKAFEYLQEGRAKFPENQTLLYSEINYFLQEGKTKELEERLKIAIEKDPENKTLYSVLGNTYDNLMTAKNEELKELKPTDPKFDEIATQSDELFAKAESYYKIALEKDAEYFDVIYSIGALYFNKAVMFVNVRNKADINDQKTYDKYDKKFKEYISVAFPFFVKAEKLNPGDRSVIIALKECYANANQIVLSNEFKKRLEKVSNGEAIDTPFDGHPEKLF